MWVIWSVEPGLYTLQYIVKPLAFVTNRISASGVAQEIVTDWALVYFPAGGLKVGVATTPVYVPLATALSVIPLLNALALSFVVLVKVSGLLYTIEEDVGLNPSVV